MNETYRIVDDDMNVIDDLINLTLEQAETALCRVLNEGADAYLVEEED